jgi:uncharacterized delta-60 repeat protein
MSMKKVQLFLFSAFLFAIPNFIWSQAGQPDSTFGNDGQVITTLGYGGIYGVAMAIQPDGKIVEIGDTGGYVSSLITRFNLNGTIDSTFNSNGIQIPGLAEPGALAIQSDGKIVVVGKEGLIRLNPEGTMDASFGAGGKVVDTSISMLISVAIQNDGKILAGGSDNSNRAILLRYNTDGTQDNTFAAKILMSVSFDQVSKIILQPNQQILVSTDTAIQRLQSNGSLDGSFGSNGILAGRGFLSALQSDGKILAEFSPSRIFRFNNNGTPDSTFGTNGTVIFSWPGFKGFDYSLFASIAQQSDGKILMTGEYDYPGGPDKGDNGFSLYGLVRFNTNGETDSSFASNGIILSSDIYTEAYTNTVALEPDGKIVISGQIGFGLIFLARYLSGLNTGIIDFGSMNNIVFIYPNPIGQNETVTFSFEKPEYISIRLLDIQGRLIKTFAENQLEKAGEHKQTLSFPETLTAGNYLLCISSPEGNVSIKLVK